MIMNHKKSENLSFIVAANIAGPGYKVNFSEKLYGQNSREWHDPKYNQVEIISPLPHGDLSQFWQIWNSLYRPDQINYYRYCLPEMLKYWATPWQDYYQAALARMDF